MIARLAGIIFLAASVTFSEAPRGMNFKTQEIDASLKIGYAVCIVDIDGDGKPDIVVVDKDRVIWFENPTWKLHAITNPGQTALDNVCIAPHDIDGDGQIDLALGAGWKFGNTNDPSTFQWLRRGKTLDEPWQIFPITFDQPMLHRMRWAKINGQDVLVTVPLVGHGATAKNNWSEAGPKIQIHRIPKDSTKPDWPSKTINDSLHVAHNFQPLDEKNILVASYEGVSRLTNDGENWNVARIGDGDQSNPTSNRGASEIKLGKLKDGSQYIATIEPWHGNKAVVYTQASGAGDWTRRVVDDQLQWGHAVWCADLDGDGDDELIVGVRDDLPGKAKSGVRIYDPPDWTKTEIDPGGVAVEDLAVADLNGDGKPDIVAVGRATKNVRICWNEGVK